MKILPCERCPGGRARLSDTEYYWIQRWPGPQYRCAACGKAYRITPAEFARIPPASRRDLDRGAPLDAMARDLVGSDPAEVELAKQRLVAGDPPDVIRARAIDSKVDPEKPKD